MRQVCFDSSDYARRWPDFLIFPFSSGKSGFGHTTDTQSRYPEKGTGAELRFDLGAKLTVGITTRVINSRH